MFIGCDTRRSEPPAEGPSLPRFAFAGLTGKHVQLKVSDNRADREASFPWTSTVESDVARSLREAGVLLDARGDYRFELRLNVMRSDFGNREWTGCAAMTAAISGPGQGEPRVFDAERCVRKGNMSGYATADEALQEAYGDVLAKLLSDVDLRFR